MNIFGENFMMQLKEGIITIINDALKILIEKEKPINQRYLNKKEAIKYIGGMDSEEFNMLQNMGLKTIILTRPTGQTSIRYDVEDLDKFMAMHKV